MNQWNPAVPSIPAPRTHGDPDAIKAVLASGLVFTGKTEIPTIDWHPYLEHKLDMHNVHQSFAVRKRIRTKLGSSDHQVIWFTEVRGAATQFDQVPMALSVIDEWMTNLRKNPTLGVVKNRPQQAQDSCFDKDGVLMAKGDGVWDGVLDTTAQRNVYAGVPDVQHVTNLGGGADRRRDLQVRFEVGECGGRRRHLRNLEAHAGRDPKAPNNLPRRRLRL
jgi:hypothetical protein